MGNLLFSIKIYLRDLVYLRHGIFRVIDNVHAVTLSSAGFMVYTNTRHGSEIKYPIISISRLFGALLAPYFESYLGKRKPEEK